MHFGLTHTYTHTHMQLASQPAVHSIGLAPFVFLCLMMDVWMDGWRPLKVMLLLVVVLLIWLRLRLLVRAVCCVPMNGSMNAMNGHRND